MENEELIILGETNWRNERKRFGIRKADRRRHMYIVGKTGMGKSTLLLNCIVQDIRLGNGIAVLDPHGDLAEKILDYIPSHRINETIYFNPADTEYPIAFNPLYHKDPKQRHLVASGIIQVFKKIWTDSWGPRLEYVLRNVLLALLERNGQTLLAVSRMLSDEVFREKVVRGIEDPVVRHFWTHEFVQYPKVFRAETISPIQNKVGQFLSDPLIRNIVGQTKTKFDLDKVMDNSGILIMNLAKGKIGEDNSSLLGALMVTQIHLAALRRAGKPENQRRDFYLYIDELQSFTTDDFPSILAESRKYGLNIAGMANQFISQLSQSLSSALLGNVGTLIAFSCGSEDATLLANEFFPPFSAKHLQELRQFEMYLRLSISGRTSVSFSANSFPFGASLYQSHGNNIIEQSRLRYCQSTTMVGKHIRDWMRI